MAKQTLPLWRLWARTARRPTAGNRARFNRSVQILVSAATREDAIEALHDGVVVTRCVREVRS